LAGFNPENSSDEEDKVKKSELDEAVKKALEQQQKEMDELKE